MYHPLSFIKGHPVVAACLFMLPFILCSAMLALLFTIIVRACMGACMCVCVHMPSQWTNIVSVAMICLYCFHLDICILILYVCYCFDSFSASLYSIMSSLILAVHHLRNSLYLMNVILTLVLVGWNVTCAI